MTEPTDPFTPLATASTQLHELYESYVDSGFSEFQALELTKAVLVAGLTLFQMKEEGDG